MGQPPQDSSNAGTYIANDGSKLNPTAVLLAKSIRTIESGTDYSATGDNGQSRGAYQFNGNNFSDWATQYGLDANDFSPKNQDRVAYTRINDLLNKGLKPSEVAAIWNGAKYSNGQYQAINPAYVSKVKAEYTNQYNNYASQGGQSGQFVNPSQTQNQSQGNNFVAPPSMPEQAPVAPSAPQEKAPGLIQSLVRGVANPLLEVARLPAGLLTQAGGALLGNKGVEQLGQQLAGNQSINVPYLGNIGQVGYDQSGQQLSGAGLAAQGLGLGAQIAPLVVGGGEIGSVAGGAGEQTIAQLAKLGAKSGALLGGVQGAGTALQTGAEQRAPVESMLTGALGQGAVGAVTGGALGGILGAGGGLIGKALGKVDTKGIINENIDSISPTATPARTARAYEAAAKAGTYKGQAFAPIDSRINQTAQDLADAGVRLSKNDPRGNLVKLQSAMQNTENQIKPFEGFGVTKGVKKLFLNQLENLKSEIPDEYKGIGESQTTFNKVIDYAKGLVNKSDDTVGAYRDTRTLFDQQAKLQYPSAYDDGGFINMKTAAGRAVKLVRNTLNDNLYEIAPKNSNLQTLIQREAGIYNSIHNIAPKVAKLNGMTGLNFLLKTHPTLARILHVGKWALPLGAAGIGGGLIEHLIGNQPQ